MDKLGVDGAIFVSSFSMYQDDSSYAVEVQKKHPGRFALVKPVNHEDPQVEDVIAEWKKTPGTVGIRIRLPKEKGIKHDDPGLDRIARAAVKHDFAVNFLCWGNIDEGTKVIDRHPDTRFVLDHLGMLQPRTPAARAAAADPWADLPEGRRPRQAQERGDQGQRRVHAVERTLSLPGHLGTARQNIRRMGFRALSVGHRLDARLPCRQLRKRGQAFPRD